MPVEGISFFGSGVPCVHTLGVYHIFSDITSMFYGSQYQYVMFLLVRIGILLHIVFTLVFCFCF